MKSETVSTFAKRLAEGLAARNMRPSELSRRTGVSKSSISHYLNGDWSGKQNAVYEFSKALNVQYAWLIGYDVPMETASDGEKLIGERIKNRRKELGMSAEQLAREIGVSPSTVYRYESEDIAFMGIDKLKPIAEALSTTPQYLMGWEDKNPPIPSEPDRRLREVVQLFQYLSAEEQALIISQIKGILANRIGVD